MIDSAQLLAVLGLTGEVGAYDSDEVERVVDAVNDVLTTRKGAGWDAHPRYIQGAVMLATRIYRRRNTPAGVESFGSDGIAYVQRNDPDVAFLLEMGPYKRPMIG